MELAAGSKLGPYEVVGPIGAGGMGEVYRARDTRLDRCVALKILPAHFSCSPEQKSRFDREARTLSSVAHPHICHLYDVGSQSGTDFLVMELLEGETLAARLRKGPLGLSEVLKTGMEIADALASAHRLGLVHRDLKPSNIMLTKTGAKLMDFGLAKPAGANAVPGSGANSSPISAETLSTMHSPGSPITTAGAIVGTIQYMSPEQLDGKEADARSDLFAFGAMLYEMATGHRAFEGKSYMSVASAILHQEPKPVNAVHSTSPAELNYIISTCLAKDPDQRFQTAHDVKLQLGWLVQSGGAAAVSVKPDAVPRNWAIATAVAAVIALSALAFAFVRSGARSGDPGIGITRLTVSLPEKQELAVDTGRALALSPDGKRLAYVANESGVSRLYVRRLDQFEAIAIPDSEGATFPFFSPNGDWVAYYSQQKLKKAPSDGGLPIEVCQVPAFFGGTWTARDVIVMAVPTYGVATVPATGGVPQKVPIVTKEKMVYAEGLDWVGDGTWVLYTDYYSSRRTIKAVNLQTADVRPILDNGQSARYAAGHIVYYEGGAMWQVPFDAGKLAVTGDPVKLESDVNEEIYVAQMSVSRNGALAYVPGPAGNFFRNLFLVTRKGQERKIGIPPQDYVDPTFSPDGKRVAVALRSATVGQALLVVDPDRAAITNLLSNTFATAPVWSPEGRYLLFDQRDPVQKLGIYRISVNGGAPPQLLRTTSLTSHVTSATGEIASVSVNDPTTNTDLWFLSLREPFELKPFKVTAAAERQGALSPDGQWLAYASNDTGRWEIYVEPVPGPGGRQQISSDGGEQPRWVRNGKEILYRNGTKMISVPVQTRPTFQAGKAVELFDRKFDRGGAVPGYDVSPDGQTLVMTRSERDRATQIRVVLGSPLTTQGAK
jgi:Tol biopolymer transport system component